MALTLYNSLTRRPEPLMPTTPGIVKLYSCGPTVYNYVHIGNMRSFLLSDLLTRVLLLFGYRVEKTMNITDVGHLTNDDIADATGEDKMLRAAREQSLTPLDIANRYTEAFHEDEQALRIRPADHYPRATSYIAEQIAMTEQLLERGHAYVVRGSVYFRVGSLPSYGVLSGNLLDELSAGKRVAVQDEKEDPRDFALWKAVPPEHLMRWESPWGVGCPGWHIECSAMGRSTLGFPIDIHTGGEDNLFPHHECERAQNCGTMGEQTEQVKVWMHAKHLMVDGEKMSKSTGNFYTVRDVLARGYTGTELRWCLLVPHYRTSMNFSFTALEEARSNIRRLRNWHGDLTRALPEASVTVPRDPSLPTMPVAFRARLADDLNAAGAVGVVFETMKLYYTLPEHHREDINMLITFLEQEFDAVFAVLTPERESTETQALVQQLITARDSARAAKDWAESDRLRSEIETLGYLVKDSPEGTVVQRV
ncbi:cysteine--tRNA ligase [Candidatus Peribacteria bacterium]|nr:cysteine--tRNA ligase [Candidatus Peribacteria bacterium]